MERKPAGGIGLRSRAACGCGQRETGVHCARLEELEARLTTLEQRERATAAVLALVGELAGADTLLARLLRVPSAGELTVDA